MRLAVRHLLLKRLCLVDMCHSIDILYYSGRSLFCVFSQLFLFLAALIFICIRICNRFKFNSYSFDKPSNKFSSIMLFLSYHFEYWIRKYNRTMLCIFYHYHYNDTYCMSSFEYYLSKFHRRIESDNNKDDLSKTFHCISFINYLITQINRYHQSRAA